MKDWNSRGLRKTREAEATEFVDLCTTGEDALGDKVETVIISNRMVDSAGHPTW
jgi:molecular chaperone HtpG